MAESTSKTKEQSQTQQNRSTSTLTSDTAALRTATKDGKGTPEPGRTLRGSPVGVSHDILNPAFAPPADEGHEKNLQEGQKRAAERD